MTDIPEELWLDRLRRKHECYEHGEIVVKQIEGNGERLELLLPEYYAHFSVRTIARSGDVLFVLGADDEQSLDDEPLGVLIVARRVDGDRFAAHVWHELYPWALKYLGVNQPDATGTDN